MLNRLNHSRLLRYAGLFTWAMVGFPLLSLTLQPLGDDLGIAEEAFGALRVGWMIWALYLSFGLSYSWVTRNLGERRANLFDYALLMVLTGTAIAISYYSGSGLGSILLMVVACVLPWLLPPPVGVAWLVLSQFVVVPVYVRGLDFTWPEAFMQSALYAGFCVFVFVTSLVARQQAHTLARLLLTDVREAVSHLRDGGAIDLEAALRPLAENVPSLQIHMDIESPLTMDDPERAHVLLRCTQEVITNAVRHAAARNLWIIATREDAMITMTARDDGRGAEAFVAGNGLRGMRERLAQYGGNLEIKTRPQEGFCLHLTLPASAAPTAVPEGVIA